MSNRFMSMRNLKFTVHEFIGHQQQGVRQPDKKEAKSTDMVLDAAFEFAKDAMHPLFEEMDRKPPTLEKGSVKVNPGVKKILQTLGDDGWIAATFPEEWDGQKMSTALFHAVNFIFSAANYSAAVFQELTVGAARLIHTFGSQKLQRIYLPPMLAGRWQGTMALTEPDAGSSLGDLTTCATPLVPPEEGTYAITGEKIFISAGDHDGVDNIVHLMLARIKGAPEGVKGISLFVVPKLRPDSQGNLVNNDVSVNQIFHKMGYRGAPITGLTMGEKDNCRGYLVGDPHKGLMYMFQMMNGARLDVGTGATGIATAAYHAALEYTRIRKQGRGMSQTPSAAPESCPVPGPVPIIEHPDVKRMLLFQRAVTEGSLCLILLCGLYEDMGRELAGPPKETCALLLDLLIPVAKSFPSEMGILSASQSIQCLGGYGYCDDFPVEQHFRDSRIHPIHEGTTGIQGLDLLGRKVRMHKGRPLDLLMAEVEKTIDQARTLAELEQASEDLSALSSIVCATTKTLSELMADDGKQAYLANATVYLEMFGYFVMGWLWLAQAVVAGKALAGITGKKRVKKSDVLFYEGKLKVQEYYFANELPKIHSLAKILTRQVPVTVSTRPEHFTN